MWLKFNKSLQYEMLNPYPNNNSYFVNVIVILMVGAVRVRVGTVRDMFILWYIQQ